MDFAHAIKRARRGIREERGLYFVATISLAVGFLTLAGALLATTNLNATAERWGKSGRVTIYLRDEAEPQEMAQLQLVLDSLPEVAKVALITPAQAKVQFLAGGRAQSDLASLPDSTFPSSLDLQLNADVTAERAALLAKRLSAFRVVDDIETYESWFSKIQSTLSALNVISVAMLVLVAVCVFTVVATTIRLAVARRRNEIEMMKLCGATDEFIRGPFVLEGMFQGFVGAVLAVLMLVGVFVFLQRTVDANFAMLTGAHLVFLPMSVIIAIIVGGAAIGALGSVVSIRRYMAV